MKNEYKVNGGAGNVVIDIKSIICLKQLTTEEDGQIVFVRFITGDGLELIGDDIYNEIADDMLECD